MSTEVHDVLDLAFKKYDSFQILWSLYVTVVFGFIGFLAAAPRITSTDRVRAIMTAAFCMFAFVNLLGLTAARSDREHLHMLATAMVEKQAQLDPKLRSHLKEVAESGPPVGWMLILFHGVADGLVLLMIWKPDTLLRYSAEDTHNQAPPVASA